MAKASRVRAPKPTPDENPETAGDDAAGRNMSESILESLESMSSRELTTIIEKATSIRAERMHSEKKEFLDRVRAEASELGISLDELAPQTGAPRRGRTGGKSQAPVKFKGPNENDTWTGRGRMPNWLAALEAEGRSRDEFLVNKPD